MPDRPAFVRACRFSCRAAAFLLGLLGLTGALLAQEKKAISVEWIYSDAGGEPTRLPPFAWTSDGDVLLLDTRKPKDARSFERVTVTGSRKPAVDRKAAWSSLTSLLGESGVPESLTWPESLDKAGHRAAYTLADDLFVLDLAASRFERLTRTAESESIPRLSPDGRRLAFVRGNDLLVVDLASRAESRLTSDGSASVLNGALSWVYWEEVFDHEDAGFWWSPDGKAIAFLRTDESAVSTVSFADFKPVVPRVITQRYPKAGGANPSVKLGVVEIGSGATVWMDPEAAPYEYVVAVEWAPDSKRVAVQTENRLQTRLDLYFVDRASGKPTRVLSETDPGWVNTHDLEFLADAKGFLWSSERDGYTHLYRYAADGTLQNAVTKGPWSVRGPGGFTTAPLGAIAAVDEARGFVYFTALEKSPVERQLYRARLDGSGQERLSREDGVHQVTLQPGPPPLPRRALEPRQPALAVAARRRRQPRGDARAAARRARGRLRPPVPGAADGAGRRRHAASRPHPQAESLRPVQALPGHPRRLRRAPVPRGCWTRGTAACGSTSCCSPKATSSRASTTAAPPPPAGRIETSVARRLWSDGELGDLEAGVRWLKSQPWVDPERVGLWGWSGGGTFTLVALTRSKEFKAGIAVAPVTDWRFYDTKFTEAYMKPPAENPDGYEHTSLVSRAKDLHGRLLLVFGTYDDNVHPAEQLGLRGRGRQGGHPVRHDGLPDAQARDRGPAGPHPPVPQDAGVLEAAALARAPRSFAIDFAGCPRPLAAIFSARPRRPRPPRSPCRAPRSPRTRSPRSAARS